MLRIRNNFRAHPPGAHAKKSPDVALSNVATSQYLVEAPKNQSHLIELLPCRRNSSSNSPSKARRALFPMPNILDVEEFGMEVSVKCCARATFAWG